MSYPEVNLFEDSSLQQKRQWLGGSYYDPPTFADVLATTFERRKPAAVSSPIRADKTRAPTSFHHYWWGAAGPYGQLQAYRTPYPGWFYQVNGPLASPPTRSTILGAGYNPRMGEAAYFKAKVALKDSKVSLGVALAEARKTAELISSTSSGFGKALDTMMAKNWKALGKMASWKKMPGKYLELVYGWAPSFNDVLGSAEALSDTLYLDGMLPSITARGTEKLTDPIEWDVAQSTGVGRFYYKLEKTELHQWTLVYHLPTNILNKFSSLGLTNFLEVGWELLPYSFVLDKIVPVGKWLSVLDAGAFLDFKEGSYSRIIRVKDTSEELRENDSFGDFYREFIPGRIRGGQFDRSLVYSDPGMPSFPSLKKTLSLDSMAKGLALLSQVFKKWR